MPETTSLLRRVDLLALVDQCAQADPKARSHARDALARELDPYVRRRIRWIARSLRGAYDEDDVANEALAQVDKELDAQHTWDSARGFLHWVSRIAQNIVVNAHRKAQVHRDNLRLETQAFGKAMNQQTGETPSQDFARTEIRERVLELEPEDRQMIELYYGQKMSRLQIAKHLNLTPAVARARLNKAIKALGRLMGESLD